MESEFYFILTIPHGLQDLSFPIRDWTWAMAVKESNPNHWTTGELPGVWILKQKTNKQPLANGMQAKRKKPESSDGD